MENQNQNQNMDEEMDINNLDNVVFSENNYITDNVEINNDNDIENEGPFKIDNQLFLKAILFSMVYYIISTPLLKLELKKSIPPFIDIHFFQTLLFGCIFYIISIYL